MGDKVSGERDLCSWRQNRSPGWTKDIGYALQDEVSRHHFDLKNRGSKPDSPNWHACTCGEWEGYWSGFHPHVTDHLREKAVTFRPVPDTASDEIQRELAAIAAADAEHAEIAEIYGRESADDSR
ncbi:Uncharacterised protein [Mycobacteroides abscessus subsp. abscessus]|nr:Uncharacterised protein [Mycobacteroides abscessus subsp. abscessus]